MNAHSTLREFPPRLATQTTVAIRPWRTPKAIWQIIGFAIVGLFCAAVWIGIANRVPPEQPLVTSVDPPVATPGSIVTILGHNLGRSRVTEVYLWDGTSEWPAEIVAQSAKSIRFRIPLHAEPGYAHLWIKTSGWPAKWLKQSMTILVRAGGQS